MTTTDQGTEGWTEENGFKLGVQTGDHAADWAAACAAQGLPAEVSVAMFVCHFTGNAQLVATTMTSVANAWERRALAAEAKLAERNTDAN